MSTINVRIEADKKQQLEMLFADLGIDVSAGIRLFINQCLSEGGIPFQPKTKRRYIPLAERLTEADYNSDYKPEEWDTGSPIGREVW